MLNQDRTKFIGGSDVPIILGLSSFKTPYQLYLEKIGLSDIDFEDTPLQYWGKQIEPLIRNEFAKRNNTKVLHGDELPQIIHPLHDYLRGNLDGFIEESNSVFEAKCANSFMGKDWGMPGTDEIPLSYLVQVAYYCALKNADYADIAVLIGGYEYRQYIYHRSFELEDKILSAAKDFWNNVQQSKEPALIDIEDIKLKYNFATPLKKIQVNDSIYEKCGLVSVLKEQAKEITKKEASYKKEIMEFMADAECLTDESGKTLATWKANKKGTRTFLLKGITDND